MCLGLQKLVTEGEKIRCSGDSKNYYFWDSDAGSWHKTCNGKILSLVIDTKADGIFYCSCCLVSNLLTMTLFPHTGHNGDKLWI